MHDLFYYYSWKYVPDVMLRAVMEEFKANGIDTLVFSHAWATRILKEPEFFPVLMTSARNAGVRLGAVHAPWGAAFDLNCSDRARRPKMIEDHKTAMAYTAEAGCRTYTLHVGAYSWVFERVPLERLRPLALDAVEKLLPEAEKLGLVLAVENSYEPTNSAAEVVSLLEAFDTPALGACFDVGHACLVSSWPGKDRANYFDQIPKAWPNGIDECNDTFDRLKPWIVTAHLHDNDGYCDGHNLPGEGRIDWATQVAALLSCPRMIELQTEVGMLPHGPPIRRLVETFQSLFSRGSSNTPRGAFMKPS